MSDWNYAQWAEHRSDENLKHLLASGDMLLGQANTLLSLLLAGIGGALAYAMRLAEPVPASPAAWGAAAVATWLMVVAVVLIYRCIATRLTQVPYNEPRNMYKPALNLSADEIRGFEMEGVQIRIDSTRARNSVVAFWLDACRYAAAATPMVFALTIWVVAGR